MRRCAIILVFTLAASAQQSPRDIFERAVADFTAGRVTEAARGFDQLATAAPGSAPQLWQRGIALYYAGRYKDCRAQFELHRTVNPNDVENAAWHFLCVARQESPETARAALLPVGPDSRVPMTQIYRMFRGELKPDDVLAAQNGDPASEFYAHYYAGLYYDVMGDRKTALGHIRIAAAERFAGFGFMSASAKVHLGLLERSLPR